MNKLGKKNDSFGFNLLEFNSLLEGSTYFGYKYKQNWVGDLLRFNKDGDIYDFEDEDITFYYPTARNQDSIFYFKIKNKYFICESNLYIYYTNFQFEMNKKYNFIIVERFVKFNNTSTLLYFVTFKYLNKWSIMFQNNHRFNLFYPEDNYMSLDSLLRLNNLNIFLFKNLDIKTIEKSLLVSDFSCL